jgi:hypothetical protein
MTWSEAQRAAKLARLSLGGQLIRLVEGDKSGACRDQVDVGEAGLADKGLDVSIGRRVKERFKARPSLRSFGEETSGEIALGVRINREHPLAAFLAHPHKKPHRVRLADATLEVENGKGSRMLRQKCNHARILTYT